MVQHIAGGLRGRLIDIDEAGDLRERMDHVLCWNQQGKIILVSAFENAKEKIPLDRIQHLPADSFLVPGAIDCHLHYPQTRIIGGFGTDLLDWLDTHVWPEEKSFAAQDYAADVAKQFFRQLLRSGTTTAMAFGSQFPVAMEELFSHASVLGMSLFSGLVGQDRGTLPAVEQSPQQFVEASHSLIKSWHEKARIQYTVMPRFSVACTPAMLEACGELLRKHPSIYMQTHINESVSEISAVKQLFPEHKDYLDTYESFGLLGPRSSFAHSIHTTDAELLRMREHDCRVVHCPSSNGFLGSGAFPYQAHKAHDLSIGVGTDVGAGLSFSMWKEMGHAHLMQMRLPEQERFRWTGTTMLKAMTRDGAAFLGMEDQLGSLDTGKWADLALVMASPKNYLSQQQLYNQSLSTEHYLFRLATSMEDDLIARTWIAGQAVFDRDGKELYHPSLGAMH